MSERFVFVVVFLACLVLSGCSTAPSDMTVNGMVKLTSLNGLPPGQVTEYSSYGVAGEIDSEVNIVADDGPGNYSGQPWCEVVTNMVLKSSTPKAMIYGFTAQVPDDGVMYQITPICCVDAEQSWEGNLPWHRCSKGLSCASEMPALDLDP